MFRMKIPSRYGLLAALLAGSSFASAQPTVLPGQEAAEMEAKEVSILNRIGIADPYENSANLSITNKLRPLDLT